MKAPITRGTSSGTDGEGHWRRPLSLLATTAALADEHAMPAKALPTELESLKKLVGTWQGKAQMGTQEIPVTIVYESTAGGTAVLERLFPGTPHEMTSVYTAEGDKVVIGSAKAFELARKK
jgi:hypothetical protein